MPADTAYRGRQFGVTRAGPDALASTILARATWPSLVAWRVQYYLAARAGLAGHIL